MVERGVEGQPNMVPEPRTETLFKAATGAPVNARRSMTS